MAWELLIRNCSFYFSYILRGIVGLVSWDLWLGILRPSDHNVQISGFQFHSSYFQFHISNSNCQISAFRFRNDISDFIFHIPYFRYPISCLKCRVSCFMFQISDFLCHIAWLIFEVFRLPVCIFHVWYFRFLDFRF